MENVVRSLDEGLHSLYFNVILKQWLLVDVSFLLDFYGKGACRQQSLPVAVIKCVWWESCTMGPNLLI